MKYLKLKAEYVIKSDLISMLEKMIKSIKEDDELFLFGVSSNLGGKMSAEFTKKELQDLRQKD